MPIKTNNTLLNMLMRDNHRKALIQHPFLTKLRNGAFSKSQLAIVLGQWFHPLHHFPIFLSQLIAISPTMAMKTAISKILWQELGEGHLEKTHETIYESTMTKIGFDKNDFIHIEPLPETKELIQGYHQAVQESYLTAVAFAYGTEAADLAMVSAIGHALSIPNGNQAARFS